MDTTKLSRCQMTCWSLSALSGVLILWASAGALGVFGALVVAIIVGLAMSLLFTRLVCTGHSPDDPGVQTSDVKEMLKNVTGVTFYKAPLSESEHSPAAPPPHKPDPAPVPPAADTQPAVTPQDMKPAVTPHDEQPAVTPHDEKPAVTPHDEKPAVTPHDPQAAATQVGTGQSDEPPRPGVGSRPELMSAPRGGQADDLKQIKGVGPKLEALCHDLGVYHFDQIARWTADEVAWVDENLTGFKGRVSRDSWVAQAKILAEGGETEFSRRQGGNDTQ